MHGYSSQTSLAVNTVALGDYERPIQISRFFGNLHAGFQIFNLKTHTYRPGKGYRSFPLLYDVSRWNFVSSQEPRACRT